MGRTIIVLITVLVVSGCAGLLENGTGTPHIEETYDGYIDFFINDSTLNETGYYSEGQLRILYPEPNRTLRNVMICVYDANQSVLETVDLEPITRSTNPLANYTITAQGNPEKILPYHPAFGEYPNLGVEGLMRNNESFVRIQASMEWWSGVHPYNSSLPAGQCAS